MNDDYISIDLEDYNEEMFIHELDKISYYIREERKNTDIFIIDSEEYLIKINTESDK